MTTLNKHTTSCKNVRKSRPEVYKNNNLQCIFLNGLQCELQSVWTFITAVHFPILLSFSHGTRSTRISLKAVEAILMMPDLDFSSIIRTIKKSNYDFWRFHNRQMILKFKMHFAFPPPKIEKRSAILHTFVFPPLFGRLGQSHKDQSDSLKNRNIGHEFSPESYKIIIIAR